MDQIQIEGDNLFSIKQLRNDNIDILNIPTGETSEISMSDSLIEGNFWISFHSLEQYKASKFIKLPDNNEFLAFQAVEDTVFAVSSHNYISSVKGDDSLISRIT